MAGPLHKNAVRYTPGNQSEPDGRGTVQVRVWYGWVRGKRGRRASIAARCAAAARHGAEDG